MEQRPKNLLHQVRDAVRRPHQSLSSGQIYVSWIKCYILFPKKRHPPCFLDCLMRF